MANNLKNPKYLLNTEYFLSLKIKENLLKCFDYFSKPSPNKFFKLTDDHKAITKEITQKQAVQSHLKNYKFPLALCVQVCMSSTYCHKNLKGRCVKYVFPKSNQNENDPELSDDYGLKSNLP